MVRTENAGKSRLSRIITYLNVNAFREKVHIRNYFQSFELRVEFDGIRKPDFPTFQKCRRFRDMLYQIRIKMFR